MNRYNEDIPYVYLYSGELYISEKPAVVSTVLGSCVAVTMFHKRTGVGAICHGVMPGCASAADCSKNHCIEQLKYVDCSIRYMVWKFEGYGVRRKKLEVKIFGGADILASQTSNSVGTANVRAALKTIKELRLRLVAQDVGDSFGRKIIFYTHTGEVFLNRLKDSKVKKHSTVSETPLITPPPVFFKGVK
jgi:chemotaxis protein CheD